jgi:hypothetical protein
MSSINPITNPNPLYTHILTRDNIIKVNLKEYALRVRTEIVRLRISFIDGLF